MVSIRFLSLFYQPTGPALLRGRTGPRSAWADGVVSGEADGWRFYRPACQRRLDGAVPDDARRDRTRVAVTPCDDVAAVPVQEGVVEPRVDPLLGGVQLDQLDHARAAS